jgi:hypothetical protein
MIVTGLDKFRLMRMIVSPIRRALSLKYSTAPSESLRRSGLDSVIASKGTTNCNALVAG